MTTRLPVLLENLRVATPCPADWDEMAGDNRVRFCAGCEKNVYNLSGMTRAEAEALVGAKDGKLCVRLFQRADGTVITADCPVGTQRQRMRARLWASVSGLAASAALVLGLVTGRARADLTLRDGKKVTAQPAQPQPHAKMGEMVALPRPVPPAPKQRPSRPQRKVGEPPIAWMGDVSAD